MAASEKEIAKKRPELEQGKPVKSENLGEMLEEMTEDEREALAAKLEAKYFGEADRGVAEVEGRHEEIAGTPGVATEEVEEGEELVEEAQQATRKFKKVLPIPKEFDQLRQLEQKIYSLRGKDKEAELEAGMDYYLLKNKILYNTENLAKIPPEFFTDERRAKFLEGKRTKDTELMKEALSEEAALVENRIRQMRYQLGELEEAKDSELLEDAEERAMSRDVSQIFLETRHGLPPKTAQALASRYDRLEELGAGGFGKVFKAKNRFSEREEAVKTFKAPEGAELDHETIKSIKRDALALASIDHPNVAKIYAGDVDEKGGYILMELIKGRDLQKELEAREASGTPMNPDDVANIIRQVANGLQAANEQGIVHRDIKPANIIRATDGTIKVIDFGVAKFLKAVSGTERPSTRRIRKNIPESVAADPEDQIIGTPIYMSPEEMFGKNVGEMSGKADIYSLGVMMYEFLTNQSPFEGDALAAIAKQKMNPDLKKLAEPLKGKDPKLASLAIRMMSLKPESRPSAEELGKILAQYLRSKGHDLEDSE